MPYRQTAIAQYHHYCLLPMARLKITPPTHHSICGRWLGGTVPSSPTSPATSARRDAGRVVSPPIFSARLHESSLSPAGLPKYDLFSPRSRQKPLAHEIGAQTQPLWPLTPRARLTHYASKTRQGRLHAARKRDGDFHPRRHTPAFC